MASNRKLPQDLTVTGQDQTSLSKWQQNITDLVNEIKADHATSKTTVDGLIVLTTELRVDHATYVTLTNELKADVDFVRNSMKDVLIKLDADTDVGTAYAALHGPGGSATSVLPAADIAAANVATITAPVAATGPAALTNSTDITLLRS